MKQQDTLYEKLNALKSSDEYPFHMPGHKRMALGSAWDDALSIDITEIPGFDNLHHPEDLLMEEMEYAAALYKTKATFYLVNGSSCGVLSAICSMTKCQDTILLGRNSHKSAYHGVYLNQLSACYLYPQQIQKDMPLGPILPQSVEEQMQKSGAKVVFLTSPTYEGILSDVNAIAQVVHQLGGILIVDEAHGAHLPFSDVFPESAIDQGADIVIQSLHKTMPTFTQTALLHVCSDRVDLGRLKQYLGMFQTSSPSYVFMASISHCLHMDEEKRQQMMQTWKGRLDKFVRKCKSLTNLQLFDETAVHEVYDAKKDPSKLVILVKDCQDEDGSVYDGRKLADELKMRFHLQVEMASLKYVIAMTSMMDDDEGFDRLFLALSAIDKRLSSGNDKDITDQRESASEQMLEVDSVCSIYEAMNAETENVSWKESVNRVSAEFIYCYPPGCPILVPGERVTDQVVKTADQLSAAGIEVQGTKDYSLSKIQVLIGK